MTLGARRYFFLFVAVAVAGCFTRSAHARCGDFGGLGVMAGGAGGLGATLLGGFAFPAIALVVKPSLNYWPGVGYTMLAGTAGTVIGTASVAGDCPDPESMYVPTLMAVSMEGITTLIWAAASKPEPPPVAVSVATSRSGDGAVLNLTGRF